MSRVIRPSVPGKLPETLKDPCNDRSCTDTPLPPAESLGLDVCYGESGKPDLKLLRRHLSVEGALSQELLFDLIEKAADLFDREPNLLKLEDPITVVGDIHGQFWDLMKLFEVGGAPGDGQYLFLGDYVDRGSFAVEVTAYLFACKVRHPKKVFMLRGNHECRQMTSFFNFREECEYKYDISIYNAFMEAFDTLPLCATINSKYFAVHGGISPDLSRLSDLGEIDRLQEPPREGMMCDLIWSDPLDVEDDERHDRKKKAMSKHFVPNETRGCSYFFSSDSAAKFLKRNAMLSIVRAHEAQPEGYKMHKSNPSTGFPSVITVFSAPNYCDTYNNKAAILKFDNSTLNVLQFNSAPHPYHLPNFMDIFAWSMPFVIEKVMEFASEVFASHGELELGEEEMAELPPAVAKMLEDVSRGVHVSGERLEIVPNEHVDVAGGDDSREELLNEKVGRMRKKVRAIARMARVFKTLREENQLIVKLKGVCPGHRLKPGVLLDGREGLRNELDTFKFVQQVDAENELRPEEFPDHPERMTRTLSLHKKRERRKTIDEDPEDPPRTHNGTTCEDELS
mmetsp:Transcript_53619/g.149173  ORF Transcript_53619/g.149173 Transcript_53619/m.149173 type:complete len:567 (-) Transcript_53619:131-1831(-)